MTSTLFSSLGLLPALGGMEAQVTGSSLGASSLAILLHQGFASISTASLGPLGLLVQDPLISLRFLRSLPTVSSLAVWILFAALPVLCLTGSVLTLVLVSAPALAALFVFHLVSLPLAATLPGLGLSVALPAGVTPLATPWPFLLDLGYEFVVLAVLLGLPGLVADLLPYPRLKSLSLTSAPFLSCSLLTWSP